MPVPSSQTGRKLRLYIVGELAFAAPLIDYFGEHRGYDLATERWSRSQKEGNPCPWGEHVAPDIVLVEWCREQALFYSRNKKAGQTLVLRIHAQDYDSEAARSIDWRQVDHIVFVSPEYRRRFLNLYPEFEARSSLLRNHFDPARFDLPKQPGSERHLGLLGIYEHIKRPDLALDLLESIHRYVSDFVLFYKGGHPWQRDHLWSDPAKRDLSRHFYNRLRRSELAGQIVFSPQDRQTPQWLTNIGVILSTSNLESCHLAVAEGMASGAVPVIRGWAGADWQYPSQFVLPYEERAFVEAATEFILELRDPERRRQLSAEAREFARTHFDANVVCRQFEDLFTRLLNS